MRRRRPVLSAQRLGCHRQGGGGQQHRGQGLRSSRSRAGRGRRISRSGSRLRADQRSAFDQHHPAQLAHRRRLLPLQAAHQARARQHRAAGRRHRAAEGRVALRRVLRRAGNLSRQSRWHVLGAAGREVRGRQRDLPGLRGRGPVLSADHQDADGVARRRARGATPASADSRRRLCLRAGQLRREDRRRQHSRWPWRSATWAVC